jgi:hypothetical protein
MKMLRPIVVGGLVLLPAVGLAVFQLSRLVADKPMPAPSARPTPIPTPSPTPTPTSAPAPPRTVVAGSSLTWRPPACGDPTHACATYVVSNTGHHQDLRLDNARDWIVKLPGVPVVGGLDIDGGHNVIIIGGEIDLATPCTSDSSPCHGINISLGSDPTGEVYIEGVLIRNPDPTHSHYTGDGIDLNAGALGNLTLQDLRIEGVDGCDSGAYPGAHADVFQPYAAGGAVMHIDHLTGSTDYQGMQVSYDIGSPANSADYRNVNIDVLPNTHGGCAGNSDRYAWWLTGGGGVHPDCWSFPTTLINTYAMEPSGSLANNAVWADPANNHDCSATYRNGMVTWPAVTAISGGIRNGMPPGGDFVPAGVAGIGYVSPGYR